MDPRVELKTVLNPNFRSCVSRVNGIRGKPGTLALFPVGVDPAPEPDLARAGKTAMETKFKQKNAQNLNVRSGQIGQFIRTVRLPVRLE